MKETIIVKTYDKVIQIIDKTFENYVDKHQFLIDDLTSFGIETKIKLRYFYNGIYRAKNRKKGACAFIRVQLYPNGISFAQADKKHLAKMMFSHKLVEHKEQTDGYRVTVYSAKDPLLSHFLSKRLKRCAALKEKGVQPINSLKESLWDVFRSWLLMYRYRNEVKMKYRNCDMMWVVIIITALLILLRAWSWINLLMS